MQLSGRIGAISAYHENLQYRGQMSDMSEMRFTVSGRVVVRKIGADTLLVPVSGTAAGGRVYPVNETAELVWNRLSSGDSVRQAVDALVECYDVSEDRARSDCEDCVRGFMDEGLIEAV